MSFFFQAEDGIRDKLVTGVQTCALPILSQEQFAESLGRISGKVVSRWECGMCRPNDETIILIEKKFKDRKSVV